MINYSSYTDIMSLDTKASYNIGVLIIKHIDNIIYDVHIDIICCNIAK